MNKEIVLQGTLVEAGDYKARQGSMGKAGPGVSMVIGDRRCLVPLSQATLQELLTTTSIFTQVEIIIRPKAEQK